MKHLIHIVIVLHILVGIFFVGKGIGDLGLTGVFDIDSLLVLTFGIATAYIAHIDSSHPRYIRGIHTLLEHWLLAGLLGWFFHENWGQSWENTLIAYLAIGFTIWIVGDLFRSQKSRIFLRPDGGASDTIWTTGTLVSLTSTVLLVSWLHLSHEHLAISWILYGSSWSFLWKTS